MTEVTGVVDVAEVINITVGEWIGGIPSVYHR